MKAYKNDAELNDLGITTIVCVADNIVPLQPSDLRIWSVGIRSDRMNPPHIKDLSCHTVKYMLQNGETVLVLSETGLQCGAYIVCRAICELEARSIYEVMQELKQLIPEYDFNKGYF